MCFLTGTLIRFSDYVVVSFSVFVGPFLFEECFSRLGYSLSVVDISVCYRS